MKLDAFGICAIVIGLLGAALTIFDLVPVNKFADSGIQPVVLGLCTNFDRKRLTTDDFHSLSPFQFGKKRAILLV